MRGSDSPLERISAAAGERGCGQRRPRELSGTPGKPPAAPRRRWAVISRLLRPWLSLKRRRREQHSDHNARCCQLGPPQDHTARSGCVCLRGNPENSARVHHVRITTARKPAPSAPRGQLSSCGEKSFRLGLGFSAVGFPRR